MTACNIILGERNGKNTPHFLFAYTTVGKRNYFTGYGILLHELSAVAVLFNQVLEFQNLHVVKYTIDTLK